MSPRNPIEKPRRSRRAFTLVELLVVIGIIAVLISILLPSLARARQHAVSVQCMSNLRQIGQAAFQYAAENKGYMPMCQRDSIENLPNGGLAINAGGIKYYSFATRDAFAKLLKGGTDVFYCPANFLWDHEAPWGTTGYGRHAPENFAINNARIRYWYMANPNPYYPRLHYNPDDPAAPALDRQWVDTNQNGTNRDEYMIKVGDKHVYRIAIATDQSRQANNAFGMYFLHGSKGKWWKNNLYGDGHVESRAPHGSFAELTKNPPISDDVMGWRWGPTNKAVW
jgi:prepilin-type N-terminal cleavage/methylation domain-containing protein